MSTDSWNLESALVPVSGAASGIGLALSKRLRAAGARPLMLDVNAASLEGALREVYGDAGQEEPARYGYVLDVRNSKDVNDCFDRIRRDHGPVTHAVANAGIGVAAHILDITDEQWQRVMDVNLNGVMYFCRAAARQMVGSGRGAIVSTASIAGLMVKEARVAYTSSKAAVIQMTRAMALDLGGHGIRVNAVAPGIINTPMQKMNPGAAVAALEQRTALKRLGEPEEIANLALFLLSDLSSYITGQTIVADGGLSIRYG